jgi:hypothetical protein
MRNFYKTQSSTKNLMKGGVVFFLLLNVFSIVQAQVFTNRGDEYFIACNDNHINLSRNYLQGSDVVLNQEFGLSGFQYSYD